MNKLANKLYKYLKEKNEQIQFGEICRNDEFKSYTAREISSSLRELGRDEISFKEIKNGKAFYSLDPSKGEAVCPAQSKRNSSVFDLSSLFGFNAAQNLTNKVDSLIRQNNAILKEKGLESDDVAFSYKDGKTYKTDRMSLVLPDGFVIDRNVLDEASGEYKEFVAWHPSVLDKTDPAKAIVTIKSEKTTPFVSLCNENVKAYSSNLVDQLFIAEQYMALRNQIKNGASVDDVYEQEFGNGLGVCLFSKDTAYTFTVNVPVYDTCRSFSISVSKSYADSKYDAFILVDEILKKLEVVYKTEEYRKLDSGYYTDSRMDSGRCNEWLNTFNLLSNEAAIIKELNKTKSNCLVEMEVKLGNVVADDQSITKEFNRIAKDTAIQIDAMLGKIEKETESFFVKSYSINKNNPDFESLRNAALEAIKKHDQVSFKLADKSVKTFDMPSRDNVLRSIYNPSTAKISANEVETDVNPINGGTSSSINSKEEAANTATSVESVDPSVMTPEEKEDYEVSERVRKYLEKNSSSSKYVESDYDDSSKLKFISKRREDMEKHNKLVDNNLQSIKASFYGNFFQDKAKDPMFIDLKNKLEKSLNDHSNTLQNEAASIEAELQSIEKNGGSKAIVAEYIEYLKWLCESEITASVKTSGCFEEFGHSDTLENTVNRWCEFMNSMSLDAESELMSEEKECLNELQQAIDGNKGRIATLEDEISMNTSLIEKSISECEPVFNALNSSYENDKNKILNKHNTLIEKLSSEYAECNQQRDNAIAKQREAEMELEKTFALNFGKKKELAETIERLKSESAAMWKKASSLTDEIKKAEKKKETECQNLDNNLKREKEIMDSLYAEKAEVVKDCEEKRAEIEKLKSDLSSFEQRAINFHNAFILETLDENGNRAKPKQIKKDASFAADRKSIDIDLPSFWIPARIRQYLFSASTAIEDVKATKSSICRDMFISEPYLSEYVDSMIKIGKIEMDSNGYLSIANGNYDSFTVQPAEMQTMALEYVNLKKTGITPDLIGAYCCLNFSRGTAILYKFAKDGRVTVRTVHRVNYYDKA